MPEFMENAFIKKPVELNASQESIQTLSLWLIHHRKCCANIVRLWYKEILKGKLNNKFEIKILLLLSFLYCIRA